MICRKTREELKAGQPPDLCVVYGPLTATLVALYVGGIVLLQCSFVLLTDQQSTLAVVASTLLIAALFNPLRRRIQHFIDRWSYRNEYDARKILEAFSPRLRNETELGALSDDMVGGGEGYDATNPRLPVAAPFTTTFATAATTFARTFPVFLYPIQVLLYPV